MYLVYQKDSNDNLKCLNNLPESIELIEERIWIHIVDPTIEEINILTQYLNIPRDFIQSALDRDRISTFEMDSDNHNNFLTLLDVPININEKGPHLNQTLPLAIIHFQHGIATVCLKNPPALKTFQENTINYYPQLRSRFILQILQKISLSYMAALLQINKNSEQIEETLQESTNNRELLKLLSLSKTLVYFKTSLTTNNDVLKRLERHPIMNRYPDDAEVLDEVIVENRQAMEMVNIYSDVLNNTVNIYASVIANNQNKAMKFLAALATISAAPTVIGGLFGMNVKGIPFNINPFGFEIIVIGSFMISAGIAYYLWKKNIF